MSDSILLVDLTPTYEQALRQGGATRGLRATRLASAAFLGEPSERQALCVLAVDAEDEQAAEVVRRVVKSVRPAPVVLLAASLRAERAASWMRAGVADVIEIPADAREVAERALSHAGKLAAQTAGAALPDSSPAQRTLRAELESAARSPATVLIQGETGRAPAARLLHDLSPLRGAPFVALEARSATPDRIERELLAPSAGTLFVDDVADLQPPAQVALLEALERRLAAPGPRVRVIAGTRRDLLARIDRGEFRRDLHFRLDVVRLRIPPDAFPPSGSVPEPPPAPRSRDRAEIAAALAASRGSVARAARRLGITRSALRAEIRKLALTYLLSGD
jgi:DNA-binding NtrC family response regulator